MPEDNGISLFYTQYMVQNTQLHGGLRSLGHDVMCGAISTLFAFVVHNNVSPPPIWA